MDSIAAYLIHLADDALILGHRNSEWTGHGPILEQDIALSNISLDLIGQSRNFYQAAATRLNEEDPSSNHTEDSLAFLRDAKHYTNSHLLEQPKGDWGMTILRQFFFSQFQYLLFEQLRRSKQQDLADIAEKARMETEYHLRWSSEWVLRLGDGTAESNRRMKSSLQELAPLTAEFFYPSSYEMDCVSKGIIKDPATLETGWLHAVNQILSNAKLPVINTRKYERPDVFGKEGEHSAHLTDLLEEMQYLQRTYPGCDW